MPTFNHELPGHWTTHGLELSVTNINELRPSLPVDSSSPDNVTVTHSMHDRSHRDKSRATFPRRIAALLTETLDDNRTEQVTKIVHSCTKSDSPQRARQVVTPRIPVHYLNARYHLRNLLDVRHVDSSPSPDKVQNHGAHTATGTLGQHKGAPRRPAPSTTLRTCRSGREANVSSPMPRHQR